MRNISPRIPLRPVTSGRLTQKTSEIVAHADPVARAQTMWESSRKSAWFEDVVKSLGSMSGYGQRCMYCSGSESAQVEHYDPKSKNPARTFDWSNHLWVCGVCNNNKGNRFAAPPPYPANVFPIDPVVDDPWEYFFIDEYGNLSAKWDLTTNAQNARALWSIELMGLDRQALQECRLARINSLRLCVADALKLYKSGELDLLAIELRLMNWFEEPFQPDIADYFFAGPGAGDSSEVFKKILDIVDAGG